MSHPIVRALTNVGGLPSYFPGDVAEWIFEDYFDVMVYFEVLYVLVVFLGPKAMENREPFQLKPFIAAWNLFLSLFSICGTLGVGTLLMFLLEDRGMYETTCRFDRYFVYDGEFSFWLMAFLLSKIPEMVDTLFLVLTKKPIIFLHWYHHLTVAIFCWYAGLSLIPSGLWFASMNYAVHSVMYMYYFLCALGLRRLIRPIAPLITGAQLLQMVVGTAVVLYTFYYSYFTEEGCGVDRRTIRMGLGMYGSYFVLFAALFIHLYLNKGSKKRKQQQQAAAVDGVKRNGSAPKTASNGNGNSDDKKKK
jgi:elongation of very long chain fatty acids protein 6